MRYRLAAGLAASLALSCAVLPPPTPPAFRTAASCAECHPAIAEQWRASAHAQCWRNPRIRAASRDFERQECRACHSPEPVLMHDLSQRPVYRPHDQDESVSCVSCHQTAHGMASPRACDASAPCGPVLDRRLASVEACGTCHDVTHDCVKEWRGTTFERKGVDCKACHMPESVIEVTKGQAPRPARSHAFPGWRDPAMLASAARGSLAVRDGKAVVTVENLCGHKLPGEFRSRELHVVILQLKGEEVLKEDRTVLKRPERFETGEDTRLRPEETRAFEAALAEGAERVEARLIYKDVPGLMDRDGTELGRWEAEAGR